MKRYARLFLLIFTVSLNLSANESPQEENASLSGGIQGQKTENSSFDTRQIPDRRELFAEANRLYSERDFDSALVLYMQILEHYGKNSALLYNISNSAFRNGEIGKAILFLERAKNLSPRDRDITTNLNFLRRQTVDKFVGGQENFLQQIWNAFQSLIPLETQMIIILLLSALTVLLLGFTLFSAKRRTLKIYAIMFLFLIILILGISAIVKHNSQKTNVRAVIMAESVNAVNEPRGNTLIFTAHEGTVLRIADRSGDWYFVSLPNGVSGWIEAKFVEII